MINRNKKNNNGFSSSKIFSNQVIDSALQIETIQNNNHQCYYLVSLLIISTAAILVWHYIHLDNYLQVGVLLYPHQILKDSHLLRKLVGFFFNRTRNNRILYYNNNNNSHTINHQLLKSNLHNKNKKQASSVILWTLY